jgi:hypothetical protein
MVSSDDNDVTPRRGRLSKRADERLEEYEKKKRTTSLVSREKRASQFREYNRARSKSKVRGVTFANSPPEPGKLKPVPPPPPDQDSSIQVPPAPLEEICLPPPDEGTLENVSARPTEDTDMADNSFIDAVSEEFDTRPRDEAGDDDEEEDRKPAARENPPNIPLPLSDVESMEDSVSSNSSYLSFFWK